MGARILPPAESRATQPVRASSARRFLIPRRLPARGVRPIGDWNSMKRAVVCGAGGFIASHLVKRLKREGYWVRGVDIKEPEFAPTQADEFRLLDLRDMDQCREAVKPVGDGPIDEVYQLAAEMGGMGFISTAECEIMRNSALINLNVPQAAVDAGVARYFLSSSVCVYRDMAV